MPPKYAKTSYQHFLAFIERPRVGAYTNFSGVDWDRAKKQLRHGAILLVKNLDMPATKFR